MSHRFAALTEYHKLIIGHGVIAAIVFLLVVPAAILIARFYHRNPRLALRLHIWLQILTVGLLTVVFVLGFCAVGPERSLTNPHHGIGVALYTLVLVQALFGGLVHHIEKGKARWRLPLKLILHQWLGRAIALLGIVQIALGLTLYGSPKYLFILYALVVFAIFLLYFILDFINRPAIGDDGYSESYISGRTRTEITEDRRTGRNERRNEGHGLRNTALFGGGLAALAALRNRSKSRRRDEDVSRVSRNTRTDVSPSRVGSRHSAAYTEDYEKYPSRDRTTKNNTWRNRLIGAGAGLGAYEGFKRLFNRRKGRDEETEAGSYSVPPSSLGPQVVNRADVARVQQGQAPTSPGDSRISRPTRVPSAAVASPTRRGHVPRRSGESFLSDDESDFSDHESRRMTSGGHGVRDGIATLGVFGFLRQKQRQRRDKKDQRRVDSLRREDQENAHKINRANSRRYADRPEDVGRRRSSVAETEDYSALGTNPELSRNYRPPLPASAAAMPATNTAPTNPNTTYMGYDPNSGVQGLPNTTLVPPTTTTAYPVTPGAVNMPSAAVDPDPSRLVEPYHGSRTHLPQDALGGIAAETAYSHGRPHSYQERHSASYGGTEHSPTSLASPPVSVKVQMHKDGRHVTLRRLNEDEAAAERDARKQERRQRRRRAESLSSGVEDEGRFRRNEAVRPTANAPYTNIPQPPPSSRPDELNLPPGPPPVPVHSSPQAGGVTFQPSQVAASGMTSGVGSPGTYETATGTDLSAFDNNRRRRRAERLAARQQRAAQQGSRVEFT